MPAIWEGKRLGLRRRKHLSRSSELILVLVDRWKESFVNPNENIVREKDPRRVVTCTCVFLMWLGTVGFLFVVFREGPFYSSPGKTTDPGVDSKSRKRFFFGVGFCLLDGSHPDPHTSDATMKVRQRWERPRLRGKKTVFVGITFWPFTGCYFNPVTGYFVA